MITYTRRQDLSTPAALNGRLPHLTRWLRTRAASFKHRRVAVAVSCPTVSGLRAFSRACVGCMGVAAVVHMAKRTVAAGC